MAEFTFDRALTIYLRHPDSPTFFDDGEVLVTYAPSGGLSDRTDADDGWHLRNANGWLATVYDDGRVVYPFHDDSDNPDLTLERERGTRGERFYSDSVAEPSLDWSGTAHGQPPKHRPVTVTVWVGEGERDEPITVQVSIEPEDTDA